MGVSGFPPGADASPFVRSHRWSFACVGSTANQQKGSLDQHCPPLSASSSVLTRPSLCLTYMGISSCVILFPCGSVPGHDFQDPSSATVSVKHWFHLQCSAVTQNSTAHLTNLPALLPAVHFQDFLWNFMTDRHDPSCSSPRHSFSYLPRSPCSPFASKQTSSSNTHL